jgi:GAF domain-containing protein
MTDNDLKNQLEDMFSNLTSEPETLPIEDSSLFKRIAADLLEDEVMTGPGDNEPAISEIFIPTQTGLHDKDSSPLEDVVAGLFEDEPVAKCNAAEPAIVETRPRAKAKPVQIKEEEKGQRLNLNTIAPYISFIFLGVVLVSFLIGLLGPTVIGGPKLHVLYLAGCLVVVAIMVMQWRLNTFSAKTLSEAEEKHAQAVRFQTQLEENVKELTEANTLLREHTTLHHRACQVTYALGSDLERYALAQEAVNLVRDRFDLYYVGLFLVEEPGEWLVLQASALAGRLGHVAEPGHTMLSQGYQLDVRGDSTIGQCVAHAQALVFPSLETEVDRNAITWLPDARSELSLPLRFGGRVIGALDLQSTQPQAFSQEAIDVFQVVADQLAVTLENARTFVEMRERLEIAEEDLLHHKGQQQPGSTLDRAASLYERKQTGATPVHEKALPAVKQAMAQRKLVIQTEKGNGASQTALVAPITLRDEVIGTLGLHEEHERRWTADEIALVEDVTAQVALAVENMHLFEQTQIALEETDALYRASRAIASVDSMEGMVRAIVGSLTSPRVDQCCLGIFDSPGGKLSDDLIIVASWSAESEPLWKVGTQLSLNRDLMGERVGRDQPLILSNVAAEQKLDQAKRDELAAAGVRSMAVVPLVAAGGWIGILAVAASQPGAITEHNLQPYLTLASQAALSIERSSLFKQTQEALEETSMLYRASRAIGAATSVPEVANVLLNSVVEARFDGGLVLIRRHMDSQLEVVAGRDRSGRTVETGTLIDISQVPSDLTIYSDATQASDTLNRKTLDQAPPVQDMVWQEWVTRGDGLILASVPIVFRGLLRGVLLIASGAGGAAGQSGQGDQVNEKSLQPFVTLATQAAVAIENRRLFEETRRAAEEETLLNEMLRNLATALDVHAIIHTVQDPLAGLVPFDHMSLALLDKETSTLEVFRPGVEQSEDERASSGGQVMVLRETLTGQVVNSQQTTVFDLTDPNLQGLEVEPMRQMGTQSCVVVPITYGREVLGLLSLEHSSPNAYSSTDTPLLERVAQLTAIALENTRLFGQLRRRAMQLGTAAQVSQATTSILNLDQLLTEAVELIRDQFNLYYVGLFMVDETNDWVVLRAGTGEAGQAQLEQGHRLKIGGESMVGWCVANAQARTAFDVGEEATRFDHPALPETRSELALPLLSRGETIGAISVQSTSQETFSSEDITTLQTMADQLANAIQNARLFEQNQEALAETETLYLASAELNTAQSYEDIVAALRRHTLVGQAVHSVSLNLFNSPWTSTHTPDWIEVLARWSELSPEAISSRYPMSAFPSANQLLRSDAPTLIEDIAGDPRLDENTRALYQERFGAKSTIFAPLVVGGQWIGYINATYQEPTIFPDAEVRRLSALSGQAAVVAQGLRQLQEIQARARREVLIREITSKIRASTDLETILQTTVTEVSKALGTSHGAIRLGTEESLKMGNSQNPPGASVPSLTPSSDENVADQRQETHPPVAASCDNDVNDAPQFQPQQMPTSSPRKDGRGGQG